MARKPPTNTDAFLADLDAKGITYTVTTAKAPASLDWSDLAGPSRQKGKRVNVVPDLRLAERIKERPNVDGNVFVVISAKTACMNSREHFMDRYRRTHEEHTELAIVLAEHKEKKDELAKGCSVRMCRIGQKVDDDNLRGYLKGVRDFVAHWLIGGRMGELDSDPRIEWHYEQAFCGRGVHGVTVSIERRK